MYRTASHIMVHDPVTVRPKDTLKTVLHTMDTYEVSHLLVSEGDVLFGVISKTDLLRTTRDIMNRTSGVKYSGLLLDSIKAEEIMGRKLITVKSDQSEEEVMDIFLELGVHCIPVIDAAKPIGIITFYDVLKNSKHQELLSNTTIQ